MWFYVRPHLESRGYPTGPKIRVSRSERLFAGLRGLIEAATESRASHLHTGKMYSFNDNLAFTTFAGWLHNHVCANAKIWSGGIGAMWEYIEGLLRPQNMTIDDLKQCQDQETFDALSAILLEVTEDARRHGAVPD